MKPVRARLPLRDPEIRSFLKLSQQIVLVERRVELDVVTRRGVDEPADPGGVGVERDQVAVRGTEQLPADRPPWMNRPRIHFNLHNRAWHLPDIPGVAVHQMAQVRC